MMSANIGCWEVCGFDGVPFIGITDKVEADTDVFGALIELVRIRWHPEIRRHLDMRDQRWCPEIRRRPDMTESQSTGSGGSLPSFVLMALLYIERMFLLRLCINQPIQS